MTKEGLAGASPAGPRGYGDEIALAPQSACAECSKEDCCKSSFVHLYIQFPTPRLSEREVWLPTMDSEDS